MTAAGLLLEAIDAMHAYWKLRPWVRKPGTFEQMGYLLDTARDLISAAKKCDPPADERERLSIEAYASRAEACLRECERDLDRLLREVAAELAERGRG